MKELATVNTTGSMAKQEVTGELYSRFIAYLDATPKTVETYKKALRQFAKWLADEDITQPTRADVLRYRDSLLEAHKPSTVQNYIVAVRLFFQWAESEGLYPNIADHVKGAKLDKGHKKDYLQPRQAKQVLEAAKGDSVENLRDYAIIALMLTTGMRTVEVSRANIEDLQTSGGATVLYVQGKGHAERVDFVKIAPAVEDAIRAYLKARGKYAADEPLFVSTSNNSKGQRLSTRTISGICKRSMQAAGYDSDRLTAHSLRHTAVTLALLGGCSVQEAQQFARHSSINTTMIYAHNLEAASNACAATVANAIL